MSLIVIFSHNPALMSNILAALVVGTLFSAVPDKHTNLLVHVIVFLRLLEGVCEAKDKRFPLNKVLCSSRIAAAPLIFLRLDIAFE